MRKLFTLVLAALSAGFVFTSCSEDNNKEENSNTENKGQQIDYSNKAYGTAAVSSCVALVGELEQAAEKINSANLTTEQVAYLKAVVGGIVDNVIVPTYTKLADNAEALERELNGLNVDNITQADIDRACASFKEARKYWEQSEAFLGGAASDFDIDPTIDSWPLNRGFLISYFTGGMTEEIEDDASVLGFHALEFILFRGGQPRNVAELKGKDIYAGFEQVSGAQELAYAQQVCKLLKERTYQLQVAWEGETAANAARAQVVKDAGLPYTVPAVGGSYGQNIKNAGSASSTFLRLQDAIAQLLSDTDGSAAAISTEVGTAKIANPFTNGWIFYVESPYSYNSIADFQDNIRSVRNVWYGTTDGTKPGSVQSFYNFFAATSETNGTSVESSFNKAIEAIGSMPAPFVKYCSTIWNLPFESDNRYDLATEEDE